MQVTIRLFEDIFILLSVFFLLLSRVKLIQLILKRKEETAVFLEENPNEDGDIIKDNRFIVKLTYLVEVFGKLRVLNKSIQGPQM